ncbi:PTS sugar transporter subunit IIB, partial [Staphylococcus epidermidis]
TMKILPITSSPNPIPHTYIPQQKLQQPPKHIGVHINLQTQPNLPPQNLLTSKQIKQPHAIIIPPHRHLHLSTFNPKPLINQTVRQHIHTPKELIQLLIHQH